MNIYEKATQQLNHNRNSRCYHIPIEPLTDQEVLSLINSLQQTLAENKYIEETLVKKLNFD